MSELVPGNDKRYSDVLDRLLIGGFPPVFGPPTWNYLHFFTLRYPVKPTENEEKETAMYLNHFFYRLGCGGCTQHALEYMGKNPMKLSCRTDFVWWMFDFHNEVNRRTIKPTFTRGQFLELYILQPYSVIEKMRLDNKLPVQDIEIARKLLSEAVDQNGDEIPITKMQYLRENSTLILFLLVISLLYIIFSRRF